MNPKCLTMTSILSPLVMDVFGREVLDFLTPDEVTDLCLVCTEWTRRIRERWTLHLRSVMRQRRIRGMTRIDRLPSEDGILIAVSECRQFRGLVRSPPTELCGGETFMVNFNMSNLIWYEKQNVGGYPLNASVGEGAGTQWWPFV